jgi:hypothetical protein
MFLVKALLGILATVGGVIAFLLRKQSPARPQIPSVADKAVEKAKDIVEEVQKADAARALDVQEKVKVVEQKAEELKAQDSVDVANDIIAGL